MGFDFDKTNKKKKNIFCDTKFPYNEFAFRVTRNITFQIILC